MLKKYFDKNALLHVKNFLFVILGTFILAFGSAVFIVPFELVSGGISGIAIVIDHIIEWELITIDLIVTVLTWLFFFIGLFALGKAFAMKTLLSTIIYPIAFSLCTRLVDPDVAGGYFHIVGGDYAQIAIILAAAVGGALVGIGCAVAFLGGGSTGGVDVLALLLCKIFPRLKSSVVIFAIDALIVLSGVFVIKDMVISILGIISALITALFVDKVFLGGTRSFVAHVITDSYEEIARLVIERLDRTVTVIDVLGAYSGKPKKMIMVSFTMREYAELFSIISGVDSHAFMTVHKAHEINGEGWTREKN